MPTTPKRLFDPTVLTATADAYYTVQLPAPNSNIPGGYTIIKNLTFTNTTAIPATINIFIVPNSNVAGNNNQLSMLRTIPANGTYQAFEAIGHVMNSGDSLYAQASIAGAITIIASGIEVT